MAKVELEARIGSFTLKSVRRALERFLDDGWASAIFRCPMRSHASWSITPTSLGEARALDGMRAPVSSLSLASAPSSSNARPSSGCAIDAPPDEAEAWRCRASSCEQHGLDQA